MHQDVFADLIERLAADSRFAAAVLDDPDVLMTSFGLAPQEANAILGAAGRSQVGGALGSLRAVADVLNAGRDRGSSMGAAGSRAPTKVFWPFDAPETVMLTVSPDGTRTATYVDGYSNEKTVLIKPDGTREQTLTKPSGEVLRYRQELTADGVVRSTTTWVSDNTVWTVDIHPGAITHATTMTQADGSLTSRTYYTRNVTKSVRRAADGSGETIWTNADGIQRISDRPS